MSAFVYRQADLWAVKQATEIPIYLLKGTTVRKGVISSWIWAWKGPSGHSKICIRWKKNQE